MRRFIKWGSGLLLLILLVLLLAPVIFKGRIISAIKHNLNENLQAETDFQDASLSFFRSFPHLQIMLHDLTIDGVEDFEKIPLFHAKKAGAAIDIRSLISKNKPVRIVSLSAESLLINILVLPDGAANYDIVTSTEDEDTTTASSVEFQIDHYSLTDGVLRYRDQTMPMLLELDGFDHDGQGDFAAMQFDLKTLTEVEYLTFNYGGISYLDSVHASLDAIVGIDLNNDRYTLSDNQLLLNDLEIVAQGFLELNDEDMDMDLSFTAPESDFRQLFSIIPGAYTDEFEKADISGSFDLQSRIWGRYSETNYPAFTLKTRIENGAVKYPNLPLGISNINLDLAIDKPDGILDLMKIILSKMHLQIGPQPLTGYLLVNNPISDPDVEGGLKGTLDLSNLIKSYPMPGVQNLRGNLTSDIEFNARMSQVEKKEYDKMEVKGSLMAQNLETQLAGKPLIKISHARLDFSPQLVSLSETSIQVGRSDLTIEGSLKNILSLISPDKTLEGNLSVKSGLLDLDEWNTATTPATPVPQSKQPAVGETVIPAYDMDLKLTADQVLINGETINNMVISGKVKPEQLSIREMSAAMKGSDLHLQGDLDNWSSYMAGKGNLRGNLQLRSQTLDLNPFMSDSDQTTSDTSQLSPFIIPADLDLSIDAQVKKLVYTDMTFTNLKGKVMVSESTATLQDCSSEAFGGTFQLAGGYRTLAGEKPDFDLKYDMVNVQFSQIADKFSYIKVLAPIIKFLDGRFSASLVTDGVLNDNFMPDLTRLNLAGLVETTECLLRSFGPAEELAQKLKMDFLRSPRIRDTRNWLEIKNGIVEVKEFDFAVEDVDMQISGTQALNQNLNYLIKMKIPRKYLDANELTKGLNEQFSWLTAEAGKLGFKLNTGDLININVMMTGTFTKPTFDLKLVGMDGEKPLVDVVKEEIREGVQDAIDSVKTVAQAKKDSLVKMGEEQLDKAVDSLTAEAQKAVDTLASRAAQEMKDKVDKELSKKASEVIDQKAGELGGEKAKEEVDKVVEKLKSWKPFGKKETPPPDSTKAEGVKEPEKESFK